MYQDDYHNSYNSDGDTTHGSINFHNESMTQVNRLDDGTIEITDTLPKKDYYMSLRKNDNRLGGSMSRIGAGSNIGLGTMTGTLRSGYNGAKSQSILDFKPSGKLIECLVVMLDGSEEIISLDRASFGQHLFEMVCDRLELNERDYFGISYKDRSKVWYWLDLAKRVTKQVPDNRLVFEFQVKFYPPEMSMVNEDLTRYYLSLQVRQDIVCGKLPCSFYVYTILASYIIQSEAGDYDPQNHRGIDYIKNQPLAPDKFQTAEFMEKVVALHKLHRGQTPEEADKNFLDNTRKLALYGIDMHKVKNSDGDEILMGVYYGGIVLYRQKIRIIRFSWARLIQVSYKKKKIIITVRGVNKNDTKKELTFKCPDIKLTKRAYKAVVDHHFFFRMIEFGIPKKPNLQPGFLTRKYYKSPSSASPSAGGEFTYDQNSAPKIKRLPPARKEQAEDGWYTLPSKNGVMNKDAVTINTPVIATSNINHSTQYSPKTQRNINSANYPKVAKPSLSTNERPGLPHLHWRMSPADCTLSLGMDDKGLDVASQQGTGWQGCRANKGITRPGEFFYEARVLEDGLVRLGWSTNDGNLKLGSDGFGYGFGANETGKGWGDNVKGCVMHDGKSKDYGSGIKMGDYVGSRINLNNGEVVWYKNGKSMNVAYKIPEEIRKEALFPALTVKDGRVELNFGDSAFVFPPSDSETWIPVCQAGETNEVPNKHIGWKLNAYDSTKSIDISAEGLLAQSQLNAGWQGSRCNKGVKGRGKYYYEASPLESGGLARVGWSTELGSLELGTDKNGFGYGADPDGFGLSGNQGKKMFCNDIENYGKSFDRGDVIGCFLDLDDGKVQWSLNGEIYAPAYNIPLELRNGPSAFFPAISLKENTAEFNFGEKAFKFYPGNEWTPLTYTPEQFMKESRKKGPERKVKGYSYLNTDDINETKLILPIPPEIVVSDNSDHSNRNSANSAQAANSRLSQITDVNEAEFSYEPGYVNKTGTRTVTNGEVTEILTGQPNVETESYIDEHGNLVKKTITRIKKTTKTTKTMSELVTERSENDVETTRTGKMSRISRTDNDDFDDEMLRNAILAVTLMDSNAAVLNDYVGSLEFVTNKTNSSTTPKIIESEI